MSIVSSGEFTHFKRRVILVKAIFHVNRIVAKRSVFYCVHITSAHDIMKYGKFRYNTVEVENGL